MLDALLNILNGFTDIPFVELAWSHSPDDKYGVITLDTQTALNADADPVSEKMLTGFVDVFVKKPKDLSTVSDVESALKRLGIWFALESIQLEDDTGYVHYEWTWKDTVNIVATKLYVIRFTDHSGVISEQIVKSGDMPTVPTVPDYVADELTYKFRKWDNTVVVASANAVYNAKYYIYTSIQNVQTASGIIKVAYNTGARLMTSEQINIIVAWFGGGNDVGCQIAPNATLLATKVTDTYVKYSNATAYWSV